MGRGLAVLLTSTILLSGCTDSGKTEVETTQEVCNHLIIDFGDQTVIFKECEGYEIYCKGPKNGGIAKYTIGDNGDNILISGYTTEFNFNEALNADTTIYAKISEAKTEITSSLPQFAKHSVKYLASFILL